MVLPKYSDNTIKRIILERVLPESHMPKNFKQPEEGHYKKQIQGFFGVAANYQRRVDPILDELVKTRCLIASRKDKSEGVNAYYYKTKRGEDILKLLLVYQNYEKFVEGHLNEDHS